MGIYNEEFLDEVLDNQINFLKQKGITFKYVNESDAKFYLRNKYDYYRLISYTASFDSYINEKNRGKYISLDFGQLLDIAEIDTDMSFLLLKMSLEIEYYVVQDILMKIQDHDEDMCGIVSEYLKSLNRDQYNSLKAEIGRCKRSNYTELIANKYSGHYPAWAFLQILTFGRLIDFIKFLGYRWDDKNLIERHYSLKFVKNIRNGAARNNCLLSNMHLNTTDFKPNDEVYLGLKRYNIVSKKTLKKRLSNNFVLDLSTTLYLYKIYVNDKKTLGDTKALMKRVDRHMLDNIYFYDSNKLIQATFNFIHSMFETMYF